MVTKSKKACSHDHDEHHHHGVQRFDKAFLFAIIANGLFVVFQIVFSQVAHSTSLFADAMHNLGDVVSLGLAWLANRLLQRLPTERTTYGMKKVSILAALGNGIVLVFTCGMIATEAVYKLLSPTSMDAETVMLVAGIGIVVNGLTAMLFTRGESDLNIRGAFLHLLSDALISGSVVLSAGLLYWTHWLWLDPLMGLLIAVIILKGTWGLFADSFRLIIDGVPRGVSVVQVKALFAEQPGVQGIHDLHVWALSTQENALSVHLWMPDEPLTDADRQVLFNRLRDEHQIHHLTIQVERTQLHCDDRGCEY